MLALMSGREDIKVAERAPRMPPLKWEEVCMLFTTWALLLEMLFTHKNAHLAGINSINVEYTLYSQHPWTPECRIHGR